MSTNYGFEPTLDGLNSIDSDSSTTNNIVCDTIQVNLAGTAPTMAPGNNTTNLATTAFVTSAVGAISGTYVDTTTNQTVGGIKNFTSIPTCSTLCSTNTQLANKQYVDSVSAAGLLASNNTWTGTNAFNTSLPTSTIYPTTNNQFATKVYADQAVYVLTTTDNFFTGTQNFQRITSNNYNYSNTITLRVNDDTMVATANPVHAASGAICYPLSIQVVPLNTTSVVNVSIPFDIDGYLGTSTMTTTTLTYTGVSVYILKNGAVYSGTNLSTAYFNGTTSMTWTPTSISKWAFWAYLGYMNFDVQLDPGIVGVYDTYSIGLTVTGTHSLGGFINFIYEGGSNGPNVFTQTHNASTPASQGFVGPNVTPFTTTAITHINQSEITATNDLYIKSPTTITLESTTGNLQNLAYGSINYSSATGGIYMTGNVNIGFSAQLTDVTFAASSTTSGIINFITGTTTQMTISNSYIDTYLPVTAHSDIYSYGTITAVNDLVCNGRLLLSQTQPITNSIQLGYKTTFTGATKMTTSLINLITISLPTSGVWLVECNFNPIGITGASYYFMSLSATSATGDSYCNITKYLTGGNYSDRLMTTFAVSAATNVYLVGNLGGGSMTSASEAAKITRIG